MAKTVDIIVRRARPAISQLWGAGRESRRGSITSGIPTASRVSKMQRSYALVARSRAQEPESIVLAAERRGESSLRVRQSRAGDWNALRGRVRCGVDLISVPRPAPGVAAYWSCPPRSFQEEGAPASESCWLRCKNKEASKFFADRFRPTVVRLTLELTPQEE